MGAPAASLIGPGRIAAFRPVPGIRVLVEAESPALLEAARPEFPAWEEPRPGAPPLLRVRLRCAREPHGPRAGWEAGSRGLAFRLRHPDLWLRSPGGTLFHARLDRGAARVTLPVERLPDAEREIAAGLGILLGYLLGEVGFLPIHAAAVAFQSGAVLLPGVSGSGKSSTAAALAVAGGRLMADDLVLVRRSGGGPVVLGWARRVRLDADSLARLARIAPGAFPAAGCEPPEPCPPRLLLFPQVRPDAPCALEPIPERVALGELIACSFLAGDRERTAQRLAGLGELVRAAPAFRLRLGRDVERVPELVRAEIGDDR